MEAVHTRQKALTTLSSFASFILENHLDEYVRESLRISYEANLPIMKFFRELGEEQLFELSKQGSRDVLQGLIDGRPGDLIRQSIEMWKSNQLPRMEKDDVVVEDITLVSHVRKKSLLAFIPRFTKDPALIIKLVGELDEWQLDYATVTFKTFIGILQERITRQLQQLQESDERFKQAQAVTHIGSYVWDLKTQGLLWSDELYRIYGLDPASTVISNEVVARYQHPDDNDHVRLKVRRSIETQEPFDFFYRIILEDGFIKTLHARGEVMVDESGKSSKILGTAQDVTKQKEIERKLEENTTELQQSNANLQEFAFIASHDLKEPLRKISTLGDRLLQMERKNFSDSGKVYLDKIVNAAIRMQQMVDDLLALSQISQDTHVEKVSLSQLFADVLLTFEQRIESTNTTVTVGKLPDTVVVPSQFRQLFQNLISNSLKFASKERKLVITVDGLKIEKPESTELSLKKAPAYIKLIFTDNGIGFDNRFADKIFAIFQRLHSRTDYDGTGIGLAICKKIVENHGGAISARGTEQEGAEFTIIIPAR